MNPRLFGTKSSDPDGTIQSYIWTQTAGPKVNLASANTSTPSFIAPHVLADTTLAFNLKVTDNQGANSTNPASSNVIVKHVNVPPIADAGTNQTVNGNSIVTLDGTKSRDPDGGNISSYQWTQTSGPIVTLTGANTAKPTFTAPTSTTSNATLSFKLTVTDSDGGASSLRATTSVLVKRTNVPPIANAGANQTVNENTTGAKLDGSKSYDPDDGKIASYNWVQTAGPTVILTGANTATPTFTAPPVKADTILTFKLTVTDSDGGASSLATTNVLVKRVNIPPTAVITPTNQSVNASQIVTLDGRKSFDRDGGNIASYKWVQTSGPTVIPIGANTAKASFTAPSLNTASTITFKLIVTDNDGGANSTTTTNVFVKRFNQPPIANAGTNQTVSGGSTVTLNGSKSNDPDGGNIASYSWTQTSGPTVILTGANTAKPTFTAPSSFTSNSTLTFALTVTDSDGGSRSSPSTVNVLVNRVNQPPIANAGANQTVNGGSTVTLDGSKSNDPDGGNIASYSWTQTSGPIVTLAGTNTAKPTFTAPVSFTKNTTITFRLVVTDSDGGAKSTNPATVSILVKRTNQPPIAVIAGGSTGQTVNSSQTVTLDGSKSYDPDGGKIASYQWTQTTGPSVTLTGDNTAVVSFKAPVVNKDTTLSFKLTVIDNDGGASSSTTTNVNVKQAAPICNTATPSTSVIWPPDHKFVNINIQNVKDPDGDPIAITITKIMQDEPVNSAGSGNTSPDGSGVGTSTAQVRAERQGTGDGRVYHIYFTASDSKASSDSGTCNGQVLVSVPHDQTHKAADEGPLYDSTVLPSSNSGKAKMASSSVTASSPTTSSPPLTPSPSSGLGPSPSISNASNNNNNANLGSNAKTLGAPSTSSLSSQQPEQQQLQQSPYPYQNHYPYSHPSSPFPYYQSQPQPSRIQHINQPPLANAGMSKTVYGGASVMLDGRNSYDPDNYAVGINYGGRIMNNNGIAAYQWTQVQIPSSTAVQSPVVMLQGSNTATPTFVAPILPYDITLAFSVKVMDSDGGAVSSNQAIVYVMVKHNPNFGTTGSNIPGTTIIQPQPHVQQQQQKAFQPISPSQPNSVTSISPPPQTGLPAIRNPVP